MRKTRMLAAGAAVLVLMLSACQPGGSESPSESASSGSPSTPAELPTVIIGSADFDEAAVVAEVYAQALEAAGFEVERNLYTGPRETTFPALESGELNLMPEYIGSLLGISLGGEATGDPDATFADLLEGLAEHGLTAFQFSPGADQNAFAVTAETAEELDLETLTDAAAVAGDLTWGLPPECETRPTCGAGLNDAYGIDVAAIPVETIAPCGPDMANALNTGAIQVGLLCSTQPEVVTYNLVVLEDDQQLQPADNMAPVLTQDLADAGGDLLESTLNAISAELTTEDLTNLYYAVAVEAEDLADVAQAWLEDKGLL
jgi:osmoprotectant transport system substrate-binding protein